MSDGILSSEERAALHEETQRDAPDGIDNIQLGNADKSVRRLLPLLERRFVTLAERCRAIVSKELRSSLDMGTGSVDVLSEREVTETAAAMLVIGEIKLTGDGRIGFVGLNDVLATQLIEIAYGAPLLDETDKPIKPRQQMTEIERQTLAPVLHHLVQQLAEKVFLEKPVVLTSTTLQATPELERGQFSDPALGYRYTFPIGPLQAQCTFILLPHALELFAASDAPVVTGHGATMMTHVEHTEVTVTALLGTTELPVSDIATLMPGAMIWLDRTRADHVPVLIEDELKFLADPVQRDGVLGVEIFSRLA